jgi:crotonobetainyl-CoA:carnitine CoA-transferase CaiB-like acyl-CoA transferase
MIGRTTDARNGEETMLALEGIKILDLSRLAPGPYCTMLLGDLGADVLLIEQAGEGSERRRNPTRAGQAERSQAYNALGRNKRSIGLNLKSEAAREVFYQLVRDADVVVEGFRPGVVKRLGVDYETLAKLNPRVVYLSLSGFGQTGPYAPLVGHDINYISIGGALGVTGRPGQPPSIPMNLVADFAGGGLFAAFAIAVALLARERTGRGQYIDMAMSDGVLSLLSSAASSVLAGGAPPMPGEFLLNGAAPHYNVYECADGEWFSLGSLEPWFWENLCRAMGREDFIPYEYDTEKYPEIFEHFRKSFKTKTRQEWFQELSKTDICAAPVLRLNEVLADPHNRARQMVVDVPHPTLGKVQQVGIAPKFSDTPGSVRSTAPAAGQHTEDVLHSLGYDDARIAGLRESGAIG